MNRSSKLKNLLNRKENIWIDSESDTSSDNENTKTFLKISDISSSDENDQSFSSNCCLICSVLPNLSNINTCKKHLNLLTKPRNTTPIVYMVHPHIKKCHCRSKHKRRYRSSSSSSSESRHHQKKRSMTVQSSDNETQQDFIFSPDNPSNHTQSRLSPSLPPSSKLNTNINKNFNEVLLTSFLQRNKSTDETNSQPDIIEIDSNLSYSPCIPINRIVHVKDENEILNDNEQKKVMINMAEATEQMLNNEYPQPIILLKRISLEK